MGTYFSGHKNSNLKLIIAVMLAFVLTGCAKSKITEENEIPSSALKETAEWITDDGPFSLAVPAAPETFATSAESTASTTPAVPASPVFNEVDYSSYFDGMNGCAVFYTPENQQYVRYNPTLAEEQHSPCSTFKIISSFLALQEGVIDPEDSVRKWSGEKFWNVEWNQDIDFPNAFRTSCVWYFSQVVDDLGKQTIEDGLYDLEYGNQDISDWEGSQNTNNGNRALTGFWIESSLKISPTQQAQVMAKIFEPGSNVSQTVLQDLKDVMLVDQSTTYYKMYGKTGAGKKNKKWADAWFVGFIERSGGNTYFAIYLGETEGTEISGSEAKKIAIQIADSLYGE